MSNADKLAILRDQLANISSELGLLKGGFEDDGDDATSETVEQAQDDVDNALAKIRSVF